MRRHVVAGADSSTQLELKQHLYLERLVGVNVCARDLVQREVELLWLGLQLAIRHLKRLQLVLVRMGKVLRRSFHGFAEP